MTSFPFFHLPCNRNVHVVYLRPLRYIWLLYGTLIDILHKDDVAVSVSNWSGSLQFPRDGGMGDYDRRNKMLSETYVKSQTTQSKNNNCTFLCEVNIYLLNNWGNFKEGLLLRKMPHYYLLPQPFLWSTSTVNELWYCSLICEWIIASCHDPWITAVATPLSSDFFLLNWPARMYRTSFVKVTNQVLWCDNYPTFIKVISSH